MSCIRVSTLCFVGVSAVLSACAPFQVKLPASLQQPDALVAVDISQKATWGDDKRGAVSMRIGQVNTSLIKKSDDEERTIIQKKAFFKNEISQVTHTYLYSFSVDSSADSAGAVVECSLLHTYKSEVDDDGDGYKTSSVTDQRVERTCKVIEGQSVVAELAFFDENGRNGVVGTMKYGATEYSIEPIRKTTSKWGQMAVGLCGTGVYGYRLVRYGQVVAATQTASPIRFYSKLKGGSAEFTAAAIFFGIANYPHYLFPRTF